MVYLLYICQGVSIEERCTCRWNCVIVVADGVGCVVVEVKYLYCLITCMHNINTLLWTICFYCHLCQLIVKRSLC